MRLQNVLLVLLLGAAVGVTIFAALARRAIEIETVPPGEARIRFAIAREMAEAAVRAQARIADPPSPGADTVAAGASGQAGGGQVGGSQAAGALRDSGDLDPKGRLGLRFRIPSDRPSGTLHVMLYRADEQRLIRADIPFWFFRLKKPALALALRGSEVDLDSLGVDPAEMERRGPGIVVDESLPGGDLRLVWLD